MFLTYSRLSGELRGHVESGSVTAILKRELGHGPSASYEAMMESFHATTSAESTDLDADSGIISKKASGTGRHSARAEEDVKLPLIAPPRLTVNQGKGAGLSRALSRAASSSQSSDHSPPPVPNAASTKNSPLSADEATNPLQRLDDMRLRLQGLLKRAEAATIDEGNPDDHNYQPIEKLIV